MVDEIDEEAQAVGMARSEYIREAIKLANGSPFDSELSSLSQEDIDVSAEA
jgi:hypothetical protein